MNPLLASVVYSFIGIAIFVIAILVIDRLTPFSVRKEIEEDQNSALAIVMGAFLIGLAIIIGAAITG